MINNNNNNNNSLNICIDVLFCDTCIHNNDILYNINRIK